MAVVGLVLGVADPVRADAFYRQVLGRSVATVLDPVWPGARLTLGAADIDAAVAAVRAAGCQTTDVFGGSASCRDPLGLPFDLSVETAAVQGLSTVTLYVPDAATIRGFYAAVLGAPFEEGVRVVVGRGRPGVIPTYLVGDLRVALAAVRAAGGSATDAGLCTDDQGLSFYLTA